MELIWKERVHAPNVIQIYPEKLQPYADVEAFLESRAGKPVDDLSREETEPLINEWAALGQHPEFPFIPLFSQ